MRSCKSFLGLVAFALGASAQYSNQTAPTNGSLASTCLCFPGDACWPSTTQWDAFNATLKGKLIATVPLASPCHIDGFETYDVDKCNAVRNNWWYPETHYTTSSSVMTPFYANRSCDPFYPEDFQCVYGTYVRYAVNASSALDYRLALSFASLHNIRLVIRNTAHDYHGKSTGAGGLAIWTHNIKTIVISDYDNESVDYCGKAIKIGAGVQASELLEAAHEAGYLAAVGYAGSIGITGGYAQGGGTGPLASVIGLGSDQVLEWEVVTAAGKIVTATETNEYSDLYWALSGGGGGTYGVVLSATYKLYEDMETIGGNLTFYNTGTSQDNFYGVIGSFLEALDAYTAAGGGVNWLNTGSYFSMAPAIAAGMNQTQFDSFFAPTLSKLKENNMSYVYASETYDTFADAYNGQAGPENITNYNIGGRLVSRDVVKSNVTGVLDTIKWMNDLGVVVAGLALNVEATDETPENSVNPVWRDTLLSITTGLAWDDTDWNANLASQDLITKTIVPRLEALTPGGGVYLNEGDPNQPDFQQNFYGRSYGRLLSIKNKYDPNHVFYGPTAVGSEYWTEEADGRLCKSN
ncbi:putative fad binding domain protein [Botrytis cinerea BcDW1]|uniref:Putative fad binding domain protein n=1 Tax=Botryotinia fuckeliana (strain BcDW1) TaxID=1290391 RepID=M7UDW2_BOTF1|nr:putative fad binding domain protein [Botrytis cinerea BcDW1]